MKLELKHLAAYLPYKIKIKYWDRKIVMNTGSGSSTNWIGISAVLKRQDKKECLPILRPLSSLNKEITHDGMAFNPLSKLEYVFLYTYEAEYLRNLVFCIKNGYENSNTIELLESAPYRVFFKLIEWHFDVFGLIDKGLAIDVNFL